MQQLEIDESFDYLDDVEDDGIVEILKENQHQPVEDEFLNSITEPEGTEVVSL